MQENCEPDGTSYITFFHKFGNDTLLYGRSYNKVMIAEDEDADQWFFDNQYVREENKRIYLMNEFGEEGLLYDFNLELNEKVVIGNELVTEGIHLTFTAIDSVLTADGYRERWKLEKDDFSPPEYWIEGIGSESGVLNSGTGVFGGFCGSYTLLCYAEDDVHVYQNPFFETCYYNLLEDGNNINAGNEDVDIRYIPSNNQITVDWNDNDEHTVVLINIQGKIIRQSRSSSSFRFNTSGLRPGIYVITVANINSFDAKKLMIY